jgi:hypothetical protein
MNDSAYSMVRAVMLNLPISALPTNCRSDFGLDNNIYRLTGTKPPSDVEKQSIYNGIRSIVTQHSPDEAARALSRMASAPGGLQDVMPQNSLRLVTNADISRGFEPFEKRGCWKDLQGKACALLGASVPPPKVKAHMVSEIERRHLMKAGDLVLARILMCPHDDFNQDYVRELS